MNSVKHFITGLLLSVLTAFSAVAQERGTADEAKALVDKGIAHIKAVGAEKAFADFTAGGKWADRDLYIFAYDFNGVNLAFGNKPAMVGKNLIDLKDANGNQVIKDLSTVARSKGSGWHDYMWSDPITKKVQPKSSYVVRVPGTETFIGAGIYKP